MSIYCRTECVRCGGGRASGEQVVFQKINQLITHKERLLNQLDHYNKVQNEKLNQQLFPPCRNPAHAHATPAYTVAPAYNAAAGAYPTVTSYTPEPLPYSPEPLPQVSSQSLIGVTNFLKMLKTESVVGSITFYACFSSISIGRIQELFSS